MSFSWAATAQASDRPPPPSAAYQGALSDLEARRYRAAIERLTAIAAQEPTNLGVLLDLAIAHCLAGAADEAARIFLSLEARDDLPPAIAEIIAYYRGGGCRPRALGVQGFLSAGGGFARNLNLAPLNGLIWLPGLGLELALQDSARPRHAGFMQLEAGAVSALTDNQAWTAGVYAQGVQYRNVPDYRLSTLQASLNYRQQDASHYTEGQLAYARLWLGGAAHLRAGVASGTTLARLNGTWSAGPSLTFTQLSYQALSAFDARQTELRARAQWLAAPWRIALEAGWLQDQHVATRPGGNRRGPVAQVKAHWDASDAQVIDLTLRHTWLQDSEPYSPALFGDLHRAPRQISLQAAWRYALTADLNARVEYRYQAARDPIALFAYDTQSLGVSVEWVFSR